MIILKQMYVHDGRKFEALTLETTLRLTSRG